jgi:hypothetical protein
MTPEEKSLLERTYKLGVENNEILRKMRRANRFALAFRAAYWVIVIGLAIGALYFLQPYVDAVMGTYQDLFGISPKNANAAGHPADLWELLK